VLVLGGVAVAGELTLPTAGIAGFASRAGAFALALPLVAASGFFRRSELDAVRALLAKVRGRR